MQRILKSILIGGVMIILSAMPVFAGQWQQGELGEWSYLKDDQTYAVGEWIKDQGKDYFFDWSGDMLVNNYTPDGYWVGADGVWDQSISQRHVDAYPNAAVYGWSSNTESITFSIYYYDEYEDGYSIADVEQHLSYMLDGQFGQFFMQYKLVPIGNGCYVLLSDNDICYYLSVSEDGTTMLVSSESDTTVYSFIEELIYS